MTLSMAGSFCLTPLSRLMIYLYPLLHGIYDNEIYQSYRQVASKNKIYTQSCRRLNAEPSLIVAMEK
jgi:hypothetical protein